jgi:AraC-like DNA-binding protein
VHQVIETLSTDLRPKIALIAEAIGISVRSLQRRLATSGVSFDRLVDDANLAGAAELLRGPDKIIDVALAMGYSDPAHFTRAFRRWTGHSPRAFRRYLMMNTAHTCHAPAAEVRGGQHSGRCAPVRQVQSVDPPQRFCGSTAQ